MLQDGRRKPAHPLLCTIADFGRKSSQPVCLPLLFRGQAAKTRVPNLQNLLRLPLHFAFARKTANDGGRPPSQPKRTTDMVCVTSGLCAPGLQASLGLPGMSGNYSDAPAQHVTMKKKSRGGGGGQKDGFAGGREREIGRRLRTSFLPEEKCSTSSPLVGDYWAPLQFALAWAAPVGRCLPPRTKSLARV